MKCSNQTSTPRCDHRPPPALALRSGRRDLRVSSSPGRRRPAPRAAGGPRGRQRPARVPPPGTADRGRVPLVVAARPAVDPDEIAREVDQVADAGFGVARDRGRHPQPRRPRHRPSTWTKHGWGTPVLGRRRQGRARPGRPARDSASTSPSARPGRRRSRPITPDDEAACTELAHGQVVVAAGTTYDGALPDPVVAAESPSAQLAPRGRPGLPHGRCPGQGVQTLDPDVVRRPHRAPSSTVGSPGPRRPTASWVLLAYWRRGSGQEPEAGPHTSPARPTSSTTSAPPGSGPSSTSGRPGSSTPRCADCWRRPAATSSRTRSRSRPTRRSGRRGMLDGVPSPGRLRPAAVPPGRARGEREVPSSPTTPSPPTRVRDDFNQVLSDLYRDHHLLPVAGLRALARHGPAGPALRPGDRHHRARRAARRAGDGVARLQEPRRLPGHGRRPRHGRSHGAVLRGDLLRRRGVQTTWDRALQTLNSIYAAGVNHGDDPRFRVRRRARRHLAGLRRVLALLQRRRRVRRGLGAPHAAVAAHPRRLRLPRPHPARAADRHAALRHRLPAPEGLGLHRHRRSVGDQQRHPDRLDPLLRDAGAARPAPGEGPRRPARTRRPGVQGDDHRPRPVPRRGAHDGRLDGRAGAGARPGRAADRLPRRLVDGRARRARAAGGDRGAAGAAREGPGPLDDPDDRRRDRDPHRARRPRDHARRASRELDGDDPAPDRRRPRPLLRRQRQARREPQAGAGHPGRVADRHPLRRGAVPPRRLDR